MRRTIALFRPGSGLLARMGRTTLFIASDLDSAAANDLLTAFRNANRSNTSSIALLRSMARVVATHDFNDVPAFACVAPDDEQVHAIVYGNLAARVRTVQRDETLDASYALTWMDRRIEGALVDVAIGEVPEVSRAWYVTEGLVPAAGALICTAELESPGAEAAPLNVPPAARPDELAEISAQPATPTDVEAIAAPIPPAAPLPAPAAPAVATPAVAVAAVAPSAPAPTESVAAPPAPPAQTGAPSGAQAGQPIETDTRTRLGIAELIAEAHKESDLNDAPVGAPSAETTAADATLIDLRDHLAGRDTPPPPAPGAPVAQVPPPAHPGLVTIPPPPPPAPFAGAAPSDVGPDPAPHTLTLVSGEVRMVAGVQCQLGHLNRPDALRCQFCDAPLDRAAGTVVGPRPALGTLNFDDTGEEVPLMRPVVVGSAPPDELVIAGEDAATVTIPRDGISDIHFEVHLDSWDAYIIDRSVNGTFLDDTSGRRQRLPRHARVKLKPGTAITFGSSRARYENVRG